MTEPAAATQPLSPEGRLFPKLSRDRIRLTLPASVALHVLALALFILLTRNHTRPGPPNDPGVQIVFDTDQQNAVPVPQRATEVPDGERNSHWEPSPLLAPPPPSEAEAPAPDVPLSDDGEALAKPAPRERRQARPTPRPDNPFANATFLNLGRPVPPSPPTGVRSSPNHIISLGSFQQGGVTKDADVRFSIPGNHGDWGDELREWVESHLYYPENAASNGESGTVSVLVTVARDGTVKDVKLIKSSVFRTLDLGLLEVFLKKHLPPFTPDVKESELQVPITVNYELINQ